LVTSALVRILKHGGHGEHGGGGEGGEETL
jgi:hypothetical protein